MQIAMNDGICWSAYVKNIEEVKGYLENGSNIEDKDRDGRTALLNAVSGNNINIELVRLLIEKGANTNSQDNAGFSALHFCAQEKQPEIAQLLINNGANVNLKDQWGNTPLFRALGNTEKNRELIDILIKNGCDPYSKNNSGISAMDHAMRFKTHPNYQYFKDFNERNS